MSSSYNYRGRHRKQPEPVFTPMAAATATAAVAVSGAGVAAATPADEPVREPVVLSQADRFDPTAAAHAVDDARAAWIANAAAADDPAAPQITTKASAAAQRALGQVDLQAQLDKAVKAHAKAQAEWQAEQDRIAAQQAAIQAANDEQAKALAGTSSNPQAVVGEVIHVAANVTDGVARPAEGTFTSGFGPRWGTFHSGIDIANAEGTPIYAAMAGTVIDSGPASGFGQWIRIQHDDGTITVYGHMSTLGVSVGERVKAGQYIAGMGSLGFSTGSHLHFEVHPGGGAAVDPQAWLAARGIQV